MVNSAGLVICNRGKESTHNKGSIIDITIATPRTAQTMNKWNVLYRETLRDHYYILFEITVGLPTTETRRKLKIDAKKLETLLKSDYLSQTMNRYTEANQGALALSEAINKCRPPGQSRAKDRKSMQWWSPEINTLRKNANHLRRALKRKRKKHGQAGSAEEEENAKAARRDLAHAIERAKESAWRSYTYTIQF
ncbi:unnamed protein product [Macrosiphum euphorbiae]|uniref:Endonuclease/exonuclease/phosphatase domain-containing protein n=1 Tax=Macrosiphum euphorbiae TaxID=13131 RepID=A0AAV0WI72_9HEMI|nr:unnamed protein product [Macrosiphum euphorbiae]